MRSVLLSSALCIIGLVAIPLTLQGQAPYEIPIYLQPGAARDSGGYYEYRIGIDLLFEGSGAVPQRYMLDTGSVALVAGANMSLGDSTYDTNKSAVIDYGSSHDDSVSVYAAQGGISFYNAKTGSSVVTVNDAAFTRAYEHTGSIGGWDFTPGASAAYEKQYAGILGAGFNQKFFNTGDANAFNLFSLLAQVDLAGAQPGISIRIDKNTNEGVLTLGITQAKIDAIDFKLAFEAQVAESGEELSALPNADGIMPRAQYQVDMTGTVDGTAITDSGGDSTISVLFDTGAPFVDIQGVGSESVPPGTVPNGEAVVYTGTNPEGTPTFVYSYDASSIDNEQDLLSLLYTIVSDSGSFETNLGLNPFLDYEITFLLDDGTGKSIVGFTAVPEPSHYALGFALLSGLFLWVRHRRGKRSD